MEREIAHDVWLATKCIGEVKVPHNFIESDINAYSIGILAVEFLSLCVKELVIRKPEESAFRFSDCTDICVIVEGVDDCLHCYWKAEG